MIINEALVRELVVEQFPRWAGLPIRRVTRDGWDNRSFRLGEDLVVRLPSAAAYVPHLERERRWLPVLAASLSIPIPALAGLGEPSRAYPWPWSIHRWLEGEVAEPGLVADSATAAGDLAAFLVELRGIDSRGGPRAGAHNFHRGGALAAYDAEVREAIRRLGPRIDAPAARAIWDAALRTRWTGAPSWVHGDVSIGNLLWRQRRLAGVLDFGSIAVGDPACDLSIAWTVFQGDARRTFRARLGHDEGTWLRARAWALWKGLIVAAGIAETNAVEWAAPLQIIERIVRGDPWQDASTHT